MSLVFAAAIIYPAIGRIVLWNPTAPLATYFRTDIRMDSLAWGSAAAWLVWSGKAAGWDSSRLFTLAALGAAAALVVISTQPIVYNGFLNLGGYTLVCCLTAAVLVSVAARGDTLLATALSFKPLRFTGKISYGMYIWHIPIFYTIRDWPLLPQPVLTVLAFTATYAVAWLSFKYWEAPFLRLKDRFAPHQGDGQGGLLTSTT